MMKKEGRKKKIKDFDFCFFHIQVASRKKEEEKRWEK